MTNQLNSKKAGALRPRSVIRIIIVLLEDLSSVLSTNIKHLQLLEIQCPLWFYRYTHTCE